MNDTLQHVATTDSFSTEKLLNIVGFFIGLFGLIWGFYTWYSSKKKEKLYDKIFDAALNSLKTDETEEVLKNKQDELNNVSKQLDEIRKNIPLEARRTLIIDRLNHSQQTLYSLYTEVTNLQDELKKIDKNALNQIPEEFLNKIQNSIEPKFLIKERLDNLKTTLTILTTLASISFALIPEFGRYLGTIFFIMAIPIVYKLLKESYNLKSSDLEISRLNLKIQIEVIAVLLIIGVWMFSLLVTLNDNNSLTDFGWKVVFMINIIAPILIGITSYDLFKKYKEKKKRIVERQNASS
ncbi:hypothetical protein [Flavobacterium sp.]|uniref:hypothetical protein n=1 Tax=Flavobacterium sp. TaxID=239 RepID=UPI00262D3B0E|nr:hypothetical protein [Flavobacterium sp.]